MKTKLLSDTDPVFISHYHRGKGLCWKDWLLLQLDVFEKNPHCRSLGTRKLVRCRWSTVFMCLMVLAVVTIVVEGTDSLPTSEYNHRILSAAQVAAALNTIVDTYAQGRFDIAAEMSEDLLACSPENAEARLWLARCREKSERLDAAAVAYTAYLSLRPHDAVVWMNLADVQGRIGDRDAQVRALERAAALEPGNKLIHKRLASTRSQSLARTAVSSNQFRTPIPAAKPLQAAEVQPGSRQVLGTSGFIPPFDVRGGFWGLTVAVAAMMGVLTASPWLARLGRIAGRTTILAVAAAAASSVHFAVWGWPHNWLEAALVIVFAVSLGRLAAGSVKQ